MQGRWTRPTRPHQMLLGVRRSQPERLALALADVTTSPNAETVFGPRPTLTR